MLESSQFQREVSRLEMEALHGLSSTVICHALYLLHLCSYYMVDTVSRICICLLLIFADCLFLFLLRREDDRRDLLLHLAEKVDVDVEQGRHLHGRQDAEYDLKKLTRIVVEIIDRMLNLWNTFQISQVGGKEGVNGSAEHHVLGSGTRLDRLEHFRRPLASEEYVRISYVYSQGKLKF